MRYLIMALLLIFLSSIPSANAEFNDILAQGGLPRDAVNHQLTQTNSYTFTEPDSAIVQVQHTAKFGIVVEETYYLQGGSVISSRYYCTNSFVQTNCNFYVSNGVVSSNVNYSYISLGLTGVTEVDTSIVHDVNGTIFFGVGERDFVRIPLGYNSSSEYALITFDALQNAAITSMRGTASSQIDITIQTLTIEEYSNYVGGLISKSDRDEAGAKTIAEVQNIVMSIVDILKLLFDNPILVVAYIETFILLFSLQSRNVAQWWKKFIGFHGSILDFIFNNAQAVVAALIVVTSIRIISGLLGI